MATVKFIYYGDSISEVCKSDILKKTWTYNPIGTGRDTHTLTTHVEREDFRGYNPRQGTPGAGEIGRYPVNLKRNVSPCSIICWYHATYEENSGITSRFVGIELVTVDGNYSGNDSVRDGHVGFTPGKERLSTELERAVSYCKCDESLQKKYLRCRRKGRQG